MKRTILMLAMVGVALAACEKKNDSYTFDGNALVYLNGAEQPRFKSTERQYSVSEIVRDSMTQLVNSVGRRAFSDSQRDTVNNRLLMWGTDIITTSGEIQYDFIGATNTHLIIPNGRKDEYGLPLYDTCGYIPQSVIDNARVQIEELYAQERYDEIYELFHTAFTFYTCTGEEYKQIVANGGN
ncbi:MAG: hypothetical protein IKN94_05605 [Salinivirgaceae bacterium]|nr:hypothetical protein [Salinivirgaceae bacterium]